MNDLQSINLFLSVKHAAQAELKDQLTAKTLCDRNKIKHIAEASSLPK